MKKRKNVSQPLFTDAEVYAMSEPGGAEEVFRYINEECLNELEIGVSRERWLMVADTMEQVAKRLRERAAPQGGPKGERP